MPMSRCCSTPMRAHFRASPNSGLPRLLGPCCAGGVALSSKPFQAKRRTKSPPSCRALSAPDGFSHHLAVPDFPRCCSTRCKPWSSKASRGRYCPPDSRSTCSLPSLISTAIVRNCASTAHQTSARPNTASQSVFRPAGRIRGILPPPPSLSLPRAQPQAFPGLFRPSMCVNSMACCWPVRLHGMVATHS